MLKNNQSNSSFYGATADEEDPTFTLPDTSLRPPAVGCYTRFDTNDVSVRSRPQLQGRGLKAIVFTMFLLASFVTVALLLQIFYYGGSKADLSPFQKTIAEDPRCSSLGDDVMKRGGNAVDAVVATQICMSLVAPHLTGIGGGGLILIHQKRSNTTTVLDFRETAPKSASNAHFMSDPLSIVEGPNSIGIPGFIKGLETAHQEFGSNEECCSWNSLIHLALNAIKREFLISESFKNASLNKISLDSKSQDMSNLRSFIRPDQKMIPGEVHESKLFNKLIESYVLIASNGSDAFYKGRLGKNLIEETSRLISSDDLKNYKVLKQDPISTVIGTKYRIYASGPPSAGPKLIAAFNAIDTLKNERGVRILSWDYFKKLITAADRLQKSIYDLGDPIDPGVNKVIETLMKKDVGEILISDMHDSKEYSNYPRRAPTGANIAAMDAKDLYVSSFTSLNAHFGSKLMTSDGIIMNNALSNFNIPSSEGSSLDSVNLLSRGRRPATSGVVALVLDMEEVCGTRIAIGGADYFNVAQVLSNTLVYGLDLESSLQIPRIFVTNETTGFELAYLGMDPKIIKEYSRTSPFYLQHLPYNTINLINKTLDIVSPLRDLRSGYF